MIIFSTNKIFSGKQFQKKWRGIKMLSLLAIIYLFGINCSFAKSSSLPKPVFYKNALTDTVRGRIVDDARNPIPGVTVQVKGSTGGTLTDNNGRFKIIAQVGQTLVFRYLGYETKEQVIGSNATLDITLREDSKNLDEIVVVGYGTQKRVNVIGSIGQLDAKDLES